MKENNHLPVFILSVIIILLFTLYSPSVCADQYYADIAIAVDDVGYVTIDGITNHPDLLTENTERYTSKKQSRWLLNITKDDLFSDVIFVLTLPKGSAINYIKSSGSIRIEESFGYLQLKGFAQNQSLFLIVQYQIDPLSDSKTSLNENTLMIIFGISIVFFGGLALLFLTRKKQKIFPQTDTAAAEGYDLKGLNDRQKEIIRLLIARKRPLTQTDIQKELNMPKAAVSRNIRGLELKGLIEKEQLGMSNLIRLKKP